jgi:Pyruvate/2-oxoacid:ferredoxin oxidoreductase delta subunit
MDTLITVVIAAAISLIFLLSYMRKLKKREREAHEAAKKGAIYSEGPRAQHPHIDANACIGCATCTGVCPEGDVLAMLGGKAVIVNGFKCIGHGLCADACPVGAIKMVMASPGMSADLPVLSPQCETNVPNLFIAGELFKNICVRAKWLFYSTLWRRSSAPTAPFSKSMDRPMSFRMTTFGFLRVASPPEHSWRKSECGWGVGT